MHIQYIYYSMNCRFKFVKKDTKKILKIELIYFPLVTE